MRAGIFSPNPCIDRMVYLSKPLCPGDIHRVEKTVENPGGKGINVGVMLSRFGVQTAYYSFGSADADDTMNRFVAAQNVEYHRTVAACGIRQNVKITDSCGVGTEINEKGGPIQPHEKDAILADVAAFRGDVLFLCGSIPQGVEKDVYKSVIAEAKGRKIACVLDCDGEVLKKAVTAGPAFIKPNRRELAGLFDRTEAEFADEATVIDAAKQVYAAYGTEVLCTLDAAGSLYVGKEGVYRVGVAKVDAVGFVGAGDTYLAAFIYAYLGEKKPAAESLAFAARAAGAKVALPGTVLPTPAEIAAVSPVAVEKLS